MHALETQPDAMAETRRMANELITAAIANGGEWTAHPFASIEAARVARQQCGVSSDIEVRAVDAAHPETVAIRAKKA